MASRQHRRPTRPAAPGTPRSKTPKLAFVQLEDRSVPSGFTDDHDDDHLPNRVDLPPRVSLAAPTGFLTGPQAGEPRDLALAALAANADKLGLAPGDVADPVVTRGYSEVGLSHVYFRQRFNGLPVLNTHLGAHFTRHGELITINGGFVPGLSAVDAGPGALPEPALTPAQAIRAAAAHFGHTLATDPELVSAPTGADRLTVVSEPELTGDPITLKLAFVYTADAGVRPVWETNFRTPDGHWFHAGIDNQTGAVPFYGDWVNHLMGTYNVLAQPVESPSFGSRSFEVARHDKTFSPFTWHDTDGKTGAEFTTTRGNNVNAQADPDAFPFGGGPLSNIRPNGGPGLLFDSPFDDKTMGPNGYVDALVTNLFYWNNINHDIHAAYGFTEAAGNFQLTNYSGKGLGGDPVRADGIAGSNLGFTDNAFMSTPPDGSSPQMAMFRFTFTFPNRTSDFDNVIISHEFGHGVSNRLTGNASGLFATQSRGMGEGWSDFWALMFTQKAASDTLIGRGSGTYVLGQPTDGPGIRAYPYNFAITNKTLESYSAVGNGGGQSNQVHWVGTRWASALWDINHLLTQKYGYDSELSTGYNPATAAGRAGNKLTLRLVTDGLKLQPNDPSFIDARDAILLADRNLTGGANQRELWTAFARRGLGFGASTASSNSPTITTSFALPPEAANGPGVIAQTPNGILTGPVGPNTVSVTFSEPMNPASFDKVADIVSFTGPGGVDLKAAVTGFTWGNGNTTLSIDFTPQTADGTYSLVLAPDILAADNALGLDQDFDGKAGEAVEDRYAATFLYDAVPLTVLSVCVDPGPAGTSTIEVLYSEPLNPLTIGTDDIQLTKGTVVGFVPVAQDRVQYLVTGFGGTGADLPNYLSVRYGDVENKLALPVARFGFEFLADIVGSVPLPVPFTRVGPAGFQSYQGVVPQPGIIGGTADTDDYTVALTAGARVSVVVTPIDGGLWPVINLLDSKGNSVANIMAGGMGKTAALSSVQIGAAGTYTIRVGGIGGACGRFQVRVVAGAGLESESFGGSPNDSTNSAQSLLPIAVPIGIGSDASTVLGRSDAAGGADLYSLTLGLGQPVSVALDRLSSGGAPAVALLDAKGAVVATGAAGADNFDVGLNAFITPATGLYYVRVTDTLSAEYVLRVVNGGVIDREPNDNSVQAQPLVGGATVGAIEPGLSDWYSVFLASAGSVLVIQTDTPVIGAADPVNALNPRLELYGPNGLLLASDTDSAPDKRNALLRFTGPVTGNYQVRVRGGNSSDEGEYTMTLRVVPNQTPTGVSAGGPYVIDEGKSLTLTAAATDPDNDTLTFTWDINGDGIFGDTTGQNPTLTWTQLNGFGIVGGPATFNVQVRALDGFTQPAPSAPTTLTVNNVAPTGTFTTDAGTVEGKTATVRFTNVFDPSPAATGAGLRFSYDFDNDGKFEFGDGTYAGSVTAAAVLVPASALGDGPSTRTVRGRVIDSTGGKTDYTTTVDVANAPPTGALTDNGPVDIGVPVTVSFVSPTDPSAADVAAGLRYSFDFNGDGDFTDPGDVANSSTPSAAVAYQVPGTYTVIGRVTDRDGAFTDAKRVVTVRTVAPTATFTADAKVSEGGTATVRFTGAAHPSPAAQAAGFRYAYDFDNNGAFDLGTETYAGAVTDATAAVPTDLLSDGPTTRVVRGRVLEVDGGFSDYTATIIVSNVAPTGTLFSGGPVTLGTPTTVRFTGLVDPSPSDAGGLRFSFDFDNDGNFTTAGDVANSPTPTAAFAFPNPGKFTVRARVTDRDGAFSELTVPVTVNNVAPTAAFSVFAPGGGAVATEGDPVTLRLLDATHPSPAVRGAGLRFSYDFDNDGIFDLGDGTHAGSVGAVTASLPQNLVDGPAARTVRARVVEAGGLFTDYTTPLTVLNAAPTARLVGPTDPVPATVPLTVRLDGATDASAPDVAAGLRFSFDFNNDGDFADAGEVADGKSPEVRFAYPAPGFFTIRARAADRDGAFTEYTLPVRIDVPPGTPSPTAGEQWYAVGSGAGGPAQVRLFDRAGTERFFGTVFEPGFTGGVRVAAGDFNKDGTPDMVVGAGPGRPTEVRVLDGRDGRTLFSFQPFEPSFTGGVYVAAGDVNNDGFADLAVSPDEGGGPRVRVLSGDGFGQITDFFGIRDVNFRGGARPAFGDVNADGTDDLVVAAGFGGGPRIAVWNGKLLGSGNEQTLFNDFFVFEQTLRNGVFITAGDLNGDGFAEVIAGGGPGGGPRVFALSGKDLLGGVQTQAANFFAGFQTNRGGVRVTTADFDGDNRADLLVGSGEGTGNRITGFRGADIPADGQPAVNRELDAFPGFTGGVFVG